MAEQPKPQPGSSRLADRKPDTRIYVGTNYEHRASNWPTFVYSPSETSVTTITAHTVTSLPAVQVHSFHDCTDPSQMNALNCVWQSAYSGGSRLKTHTAAELLNSAVGVSVVNGLTVDMKTSGGNTSVTQLRK